MRKSRAVMFVLLMLVLAVAILRTLVTLAGYYAQQTVGVVITGHQRFTRVLAETTLAHLAALPEVKRMDERSCEVMRGDLERSGGFFAVLALGDANGRPVCAANPGATAPLPAMADRIYYQKVKDADGLVFGEYAVSRLTGKQVLHFAYPVKGAGGEFAGFVLASVDLAWYIDQDADQYFQDRNVEIFGVDNTGNLLFVYPSNPAIIGTEVVSAELVSAVFSGQQSARLLKGYDGEYRVYGYKVIEPVGSEPILTFVGVSLSAFRPLLFVLIVAAVLTAGAAWYLFWGTASGRGRAKSTRSRR